ncbi:MAG: CRTAC1 family protein [Chthonomonadales bacterium]
MTPRTDQRRRIWSVALLWAAATVGCGRQPAGTTATPSVPPVIFRDVTEQAGIRFTAVNGAWGAKYLPETMGSGCAFLDYDNDGREDILLVNGDYWPGRPHPDRPTMRLYHNEGNGHFRDVTREAGLDVEMYGMGVAVGDYDNDGYDDVYITGVGSSRLFHNEAGPRGTRRFHDVTKRAGVESPGWATSATWFDYDRDGRLDLFVCHYVQWSPQTNLFYSIDGVHKSYSTPEQYRGETCRLYHNEGGGRFRDVTRSASIYNERSKALGVVSFDFDQDGWPDLLVTNDTEPNFLFHNQTGKGFKEVALEKGIAVSEMGRAKAGMGVDIGDDRNDGQDTIVVTNFSGEQASLYRRDPGGVYLDAAAQSGIGTASQYYLGFGVLFFDYDGDGWLDLLVANGHIQGDVEVRRTGVMYREPALLLRNTGGGVYKDVTTSTGGALAMPQIGRGAAWGDYDNDGHPDLLFTSNPGDPEGARTGLDGKARLLWNDNRTGNAWLRLRLEGTVSNRDAFGARVRVRAGGKVLSGTVKAGCSYLSQSDRRLLFGLGHVERVDAIEVLWPSGRVQSFGPVEARRSYALREGGALGEDPQLTRAR